MSDIMAAHASWKTSYKALEENQVYASWVSHLNQRLDE